MGLLLGGLPGTRATWSQRPVVLSRDGGENPSGINDVPFPPTRASRCFHDGVSSWLCTIANTASESEYPNPRAAPPRRSYGPNPGHPTYLRSLLRPPTPRPPVRPSACSRSAATIRSVAPTPAAPPQRIAPSASMAITPLSRIRWMRRGRTLLLSGTLQKPHTLGLARRRKSSSVYLRVLPYARPEFNLSARYESSSEQRHLRASR